MDRSRLSAPPPKIGTVQPSGEETSKKDRGAFFTPYPIARFLTKWATAGSDAPAVLDPTCGEGVFLLAANDVTAGRAVLHGVDIHPASIVETKNLLATVDANPKLTHANFLDLAPSDGLMDAVVGNPPFVRYQEHTGEARKSGVKAALAQGVKLSALSSLWVPILLHAASFLKPDGRIAMVVPAELLSVGYAEPVRQWLKRRFRSVHLVMFNDLQFTDAEAQVVLLVAQGTGGCEAISLHEVGGNEDLEHLHVFDTAVFVPQEKGKWTELLIPDEPRRLLRETTSESFEPVTHLGRIELGTVTGANKFFTLSEATRQEYDLVVGSHVVPTLPASSKHLSGMAFTRAQWEQLRSRGERVWLLYPTDSLASKGLQRYLKLGEGLKVHEGYKCSNRTPWWRPPRQPAPDLFFTYMSDFGPRFVENLAGVTYTNSLHGFHLSLELSDATVSASTIPFLAFNSISLLNAELIGRSYGGGVLKMEPREAALLPVPNERGRRAALEKLEGHREHLAELARTREWATLVDEVDKLVLLETDRLTAKDVVELRTALIRQRSRRQRSIRNNG